MNKRIPLAIFSILLVVVLLGEVIEVTPSSSRYSSELEIDAGGFSYSVSADTSAEFNLLITENGESKPIDILYIHYDPAYGYMENFMGQDKFVKTLKSRLGERGFKNCIIADTSELTGILSTSSNGVGILMCSGTIPDVWANGLLLDWVKSGGTLYWSWLILGEYISCPDGTYHVAEDTLQDDFLGSICTKWDDIYATEFDPNPFSNVLGFKCNRMLGSVDQTLIANPMKSLGYTIGDQSEISVVKCGSGTIFIMAGDGDSKQLSDIAQTICSGITYDSVLIYYGKETLSHDNREGDVPILPVPGTQYSGYIYVSGLNPPYGKMFNLSMP